MAGRKVKLLLFLGSGLLVAPRAAWSQARIGAADSGLSLPKMPSCGCFWGLLDSELGEVKVTDGGPAWAQVKLV